MAFQKEINIDENPFKFNYTLTKEQRSTYKSAWYAGWLDQKYASKYEPASKFIKCRIWKLPRQD